MTEVAGNNEPKLINQVDRMAKLEEEAKALTEQIIAESTGTVTTAETPKQTVEPATQTPELKPPVVDKVDVPPQFKDKEGNADLAKIEKSSEHLLKKNEEVKAALAKYKELQKGFTQGTQELKKVEKIQAPEAPTAQPEPERVLPTAPAPSRYTPEARQRIAEDLEKDPIEAVARITEATIRRVLEEQRLASEGEKLEENRLKDLDTVIQKEGNDWMHTDEGISKVNRIFKEKPYLWQSPTPYQDALRFIDDVQAKGPNTNNVRVGNTPILGGGNFVPPSSPPPTASAEQEFETLSKQFDAALKVRDDKAMYALKQKMDELSTKLFLG